MILCAGEALIDMLPRESADGTATLAPTAGGAVFNTAIALGRLEVPTGFACALSDDMFGRQLRRTLADSNVDTTHCATVARPCTLAFVELIDGHARYAFYNAGTALKEMGPQELPSDLSAISALFLGGISLMDEPCGTALESLVDALPDSVPLMFDPNIRPSFIADAQAYRARFDRITARADIVKLSDEDLEWLTGTADPSDGVSQLIDRGVRRVCLTRGAAGVTAYTAAGSLSVPAPQAHVVDTVGAGDTFNAGLLAGLHRAGHLARGALAAPDETALRDSLSLGVTAAAVVVSRAGANPPTLAELEG